MSEISGLYKLKPEHRRKVLSRELGIPPEVFRGFDASSAPLEVLDGMAENVIGSFSIPIGVATNFVINGREMAVPMATEEPSVVAAASKIAKIAGSKGGFKARCPSSVMIGTVQLLDVPEVPKALMAIDGAKADLIGKANDVDPMLVKFGGGLKELRTRVLGSPSGTMLVVDLLVDCADAMGANAINTMAESLTPSLENLTGGRALLRILSNLATERLAMAEAVFDKELLGGDAVVRNIISAYHLALVDPYRASTHNKGIMNGISAVVRATGNDTRAVEAGAHSYASFGGQYRPLSEFRIDERGDLVGTLTIPAAVGTVGGITKVHPAARASLELMGVRTARELGEVLASVGLAQNVAALRALASEGIQRGHMKLHARNLALQAGATPHEVEEVVRLMVQSGTVNGSEAKRTLLRVRGSG